MVVYRDGGSDGSFDRIIDEEVHAVRQAISDLDQGGNESANVSAPRITFLIAQNNHNMRVVPTKENDAIRNNVPSGTLVDEFSTSDSNDTFDFLLTPQGGLKGTSKPIYYRVLLNENAKRPADFDGSPLTKEKLPQLTYHMAFQCKCMHVWLA
jgi:eukaryotic translation initiation factor 2C